MRWILISILLFGLISCDSSDTKEDCYSIVDYYDPNITHFHCPDGTNYSSAMAAGIETGDIVDLQTQVDIINVK